MISLKKCFHARLVIANEVKQSRFLLGGDCRGRKKRPVERGRLARNDNRGVFQRSLHIPLTILFLFSIISIVNKKGIFCPIG